MIRPVEHVIDALVSGTYTALIELSRRYGELVTISWEYM